MKLTNSIRTAFVRAAMADVPSVDYQEQATNLLIAEGLKTLPPKVREIATDSRLCDYLFVGVYVGFSGLSNISGRYVKAAHGYKPSAGLLQKATELNALAGKQKTELLALETKLKGVAYSVHTRKALVELLPDFSRYLPAEQAKSTYPVPVVIDVAEAFTAAGWPKGKPKAAPAKKVRK